MARPCVPHIVLIRGDKTFFLPLDSEQFSGDLFSGHVRKECDRQGNEDKFVVSTVTARIKFSNCLMTVIKLSVWMQRDEARLHEA
jgi:hypothetical protein